MLASQLINTGFPVINVFDKASFALQIMDEYDVMHLPVSSGEKFAGIVSKDDLLDIDENNTLASIEQDLQKISIKGEEYFLQALKLIANNELTILPVVNEQAELSGVIQAKDILKTISRFVGNEEKGAVIGNR